MPQKHDIGQQKRRKREAEQARLQARRETRSTYRKRTPKQEEDQA
jgi:hypothetical protein